MKFRIYATLFLSLFLIGADNSRLISYPQGKIMGFRGMDSKSTAPVIADGRAEDVLNVKISSGFDLKKRSGFDTVNDVTLDDLDIDSPAVTGIFDARFSDGTTKVLAFVGSKLKYDDGSGWSTVTTTGVTTGKNNQWKCVMALDDAICTNDVDAPIKVDSTPTRSELSFTGLSNAIQKAKAHIWYRNYLIFGNTVENSVEKPTRFRWSNVGTTETWTDADFTDIAELSGAEIIGFSELYGELYIFLTTSIWRASLVGGDDVFVFTKVVDNIGAIARDSIQAISLSEQRTVVMFLDERKKVLMFDGVSIIDVGSVIQPTLNGLNESRLQYAVSTFDGTDYFLCSSLSGSATNDICFDFQTEIFEWTKHDQIDANAMAQVKESTSVIKTYFGNYDSFVYWMDNPDLNSDVDGATGVLDSVATVDTDTITGAQILIDSDIASGIYTGAIVRITSGTGVGEERVVSTSTSTGVTVTQAFDTTPDSTSVYSIGDINAYYNAKHFELGDAAREKNTFMGMLLWAKEESNNMVDVAYAIDFGSNLGSETVSLEPAGNSLWDTAVWNTGVWGVTGDKIYTVKFSGFGNHIQPKFSNNAIDETFHLFGYNIIATAGDIKQP